MITIDHIDFAYAQPSEAASSGERLFKDLSLTFEPGHFVALLGGNGSGKSTLAKLLNGILQPLSGRIAVDGLYTDDSQAIWEIRKRVGLVFQDPSRQIVGAVVEDDIAFGLENLGLPRGEIVQRVNDVLKRLDIEDLRRAEPHYLSGGQKQRVALAGVLAMQPNYLVLDEPTAMLDPKGRRSVLSLVKSLQRDCGLGVIYITHHMDEAMGADRVVVLDKGTVVQDTYRPAELFSDWEAMKKMGLQLPPLCALACSLAQALPCGFAIDNCSAERLASAIAETVPVSSCSPVNLTFPNVPPSAGASPERVISLERASYTYLNGTPFSSRACHNVNLDVYKGEVLGVIGATGSGKSTLLQLFNGLLRCESGTVTACGCTIPLKGGAKELARVRAAIGFLFQFSEQQLFETTVYDDVAFGPRNLRLLSEEVDRRVRRALQMVKLPESLWSRSPLTLSGGEKRRAALAGVLACEPQCLLLDEPTAGLDPGAAAELLQLLRRLHDEQGLTLVMISHSYEELAPLADRLAVMCHGCLLAAAPAADILYDAELLAQAGLEGSEISRLFAQLHSRGIALGMRPLGLKEAERCCKKILKLE